MIEIRSLNELSSYLHRLVKGRLWLKVIIGLILGVMLGVFLNPESGYIKDTVANSMANWLDLPGKVFLRLVQMVMIPLVFASIIMGIASNRSNNLKSMGVSLLVYFIMTTLISITIGAWLASVLEPGKYLFESNGILSETSASMSSDDGLVEMSNFPEVISGLIPDNPLQAILYGEMLGVVIFTIIIGIAITQLSGDLSRSIMRMIEAMQKICMIVISWAMELVPFAVFGLMAALMTRLGIEALLGLGFFVGVVLLGLLMLLLVYMAILWFTTFVNPFRFLKAIKDPLLLAFSTASSAAVMPLSMKVADEDLKVSSKISDFVIPLGASINMDGTALFQCITALFMAQAYGMDMTISNLVLVTFTIVGASIGTPAIPGGGVIILASVLQGVGIPTEGLIVIIGIDRILGMFRTAVNVTGDLVACVVFNKWFGDS